MILIYYSGVDYDSEKTDAMKSYAELANCSVVRFDLYIPHHIIYSYPNTNCFRLLMLTGMGPLLPALHLQWMHPAAAATAAAAPSSSSVVQFVPAFLFLAN